MHTWTHTSSLPFCLPRRASRKCAQDTQKISTTAQDSRPTSRQRIQARQTHTHTRTRGDLYEHHGAGQTPSGGNEFAIINHASNRILHWPVATPHPQPQSQPQPQPNMQSLSPSSATSTSISLSSCYFFLHHSTNVFTALFFVCTRGRPQCAPQD